jgi:hypothetical protein
LKEVEIRSLFLRALLSLLLCGTAPASGSDIDPFNSDISSLEMRFFCHTYANETDDQRLDRLDELVFGYVRQGSAQKRITSLLLAVPNVQSTSEQQTGATPATTTYSLEPERPQMAAVPPPSAAPQPAAIPAQPSEDQTSSEPYPAVTALEEQILGKTETNLPVAQRLSNLEAKAFGKPSSSTDLGKRVDLLKQYVAKKNGGNENYLTSSNAVGWAPGNQSLEGEVASMEQEVYGVTYARDRLSSRLDRLDKTLLPNEPPQTFTPLVTRIDNLEAALNPTGARQQMISMVPHGEMQNTVKKKHSIFHKLGVVAADVGSVVARSAMSGGYGYGYGMPMMGGPGFGYW